MTATQAEEARLDELDGLPTLDDVAEPVAEAPVAARTSRVVLRRVEPRSVLKLSLVFYLCVSLVLLVAGIVLWLGASAAGVVENVESFFEDAGFDGFEFAAGQLLRAFAVIAVILVVAGTVANLLLAALFNLMSDVVGGVRITLAEDVEGKGRRR